MADPAKPHAEDWAPPGLEALHEMHFALRDGRALAHVAQRLSDAGAELQSLAMNRQAGALSVRCRVSGVSAAGARAFIDDLARNGIIAAPIAVEHLMLARARPQN